MIVMKFGGTSVGDAQRINMVCELVRSRLPRNPLVVTSAHSGITNMLVDAANAAVDGNPDITAVAKRQYEVIDSLGLSHDLVDPLLADLQDLLKGICMVEELTARTSDLVLSFGERMSVLVLAAAMQKNGINAVAKNSYDLGLRSDANYGNAAPDVASYHDVARTVRGIKADVIITTGFIAKSPDGHISTFGRGGSDYSATIFGAALDAQEVEIWTDVNGVMSADPRVVKAAVSIPELTFTEAAELAWYGAKVLHPATVQPAVEKNIPVRVLNTYEPDNPGTVILCKTSQTSNLAKSVVQKKNATLVHIVSSRMLMTHGFMARVFNIFEEYGIVINMIATSEITISLTTDATTEKLEPAIRKIRAFSTVTVKNDHALVCLIGEGMGGVKGVAARFFGALAKCGVNVQMISQGASEINIAALVNNTEIEAAVKAVHAEFFEN